MHSTDFDAVFSRLQNLVADLNIQAQMYDDLFSLPENALVFNEAAGNFFKHLRWFLQQLIFGSISRLLDPPETCGHENLSLRGILDYEQVDPIRNKLAHCLSQIESAWVPGVKVWRNKILSHNDLATLLQKSPLPEIEIEVMLKLVDGITQFVRQIERDLFYKNVSYKIKIDAWVPRLIRCLKRGIEAASGDV